MSEQDKRTSGDFGMVGDEPMTCGLCGEEVENEACIWCKKCAIYICENHERRIIEESHAKFEHDYR